jgi:DNA (cytosine-5)-methyltransferase 1
MKIKLLDLFSGIGGFHLGLEKAGFEVESYFSEIDKYAIDVYSNNFKNATYVGSVTDVRGGDLPDIDAITFGSPCQDFSLAGKRKGLGGQRSSLISEAIRLIGEKRPRFFIWENVKGTFSSNNREDFAAILQAFTNIGGYRLEWQLLNTKWFLPQNRERIYLVGYLANGSGGQIFPIRENDEYFNQSLRTEEGERQCLQTSHSRTIKKNIGNMCSDDTYIKVKSATASGYEEAREGDSINLTAINSKTRRGRVGEKIAQTLDTHCHQAVIGYSRDVKGKVTSYHEKQDCNTLHGSSGTGNNTDQFIKIGDYRSDEGYRERKDGDSPTLNSNNTKNETGGTPIIVNKIRRLTPIECERLQGFPDDWTAVGKEMGDISDTQRYKMCGNAVTVDVVAAVAKNIKEVVYG